MADFTPTQGRYLAFIHAYTTRYGRPPAESEIAAAMCVTPPSVNQMVKKLEREELILRQPGQPRSLQILIPEDEIPPWGNIKPGKNARSRTTRGNVEPPRHAAPANLYVVSVFLVGGPLSEKFVGKVVNRVIEIRGDQTLDDLHHAIFEAYDRSEEHLYEFQFGKRPFDPAGPNYGITDPQPKKSSPKKSRAKKSAGDARTTKLDDLNLEPRHAFGYWFDFGDDWYHQLHVERIEQAIPTVTYPRVIKRVGKSPPQYADR